MILIQFAEIAVVRITLDLLLPGFNWIVSHFSQTEHRVGEDIGKLDSAISLSIPSSNLGLIRLMPVVSVWLLISFCFTEKLSCCFPEIILYKSHIRVIVFSEMNRCSESGIHEHSAKSQLHIQIFHRIARLFSIDLPDHGQDGFHTVGCVRRYLKVVVPCRFCTLLTCQLKNWLRVQIVAPKLYCFGQQVLLCSTRFQPQDCRSLLDLLLLRCDGFPRCSSIDPTRFASLSRTWDVDAASNELGSTLILLSGFPEAIGIPGLLNAVGLDAAEELVAAKKTSSSLPVAT